MYNTAATHLIAQKMKQEKAERAVERHIDEMSYMRVDGRKLLLDGKCYHGKGPVQALICFTIAIPIRRLKQIGNACNALLYEPILLYDADIVIGIVMADGVGI